MNTRALNELADLICRAQENGKRTPMGIAFAIDAAGRHMSPETAAELERLRVEVAALREERHVTNEALSDAAEALRADRDQAAEVFVPRTERSHWVDIAAALNAAHAAGMPVGIDLDGTLTDHSMWSVVWDRVAERWTVAGYEVDEPDGITRRIAPTQALREDSHDGPLHHSYRVPRDLPELGGAK